MPLAIELAAARVASLPPAEIARRLGESFRLLRQERRTAETRQQTLEAALDWSYRLLDAQEATLLRRLAVFAGGFGLDAAEDVCERRHACPARNRGLGADASGRRSRWSWRARMPAEPRYRLLEMVRQYARERLAEAAETGGAARTPCALVPRAGAATRPGGADPDAADVRFRRLDLETDNLRAALGWLLDHDPPEALRLAGSLSDWWLPRGRLAEAREWLQAAVERTRRTAGAAAAALLQAVSFADRAGDMVQGSRLAERSLSIYRALGDRAGTAQALHLLGLAVLAARRLLRRSRVAGGGLP